jgi:hypothetical protein
MNTIQGLPAIARSATAADIWAPSQRAALHIGSSLGLQSQLQPLRRHRVPSDQTIIVSPSSTVAFHHRGG